MTDVTPLNDATAPTYEMLWDCKFCGTKKLLGLSHRHCPSCGAPQNAGDRYFPSDAEKVPTKDHVFFGADVICALCGEANSRNSKHCGGCGAPLDDAKAVGRRNDQLVDQGAVFAGQTESDARREQVAPNLSNPKPEKERSVVGNVLKVAALLGLVIILVLVAGFVWKKKSGFEVAGHSWKRQIAIERLGPTPDSAWCDSMPSGARGVTRSREVRSQRSVPDGENCNMRKVDQGNGTFTEREECTPKYRNEPVYDERCHYLIDLWTVTRTASAEGASVTDAPKWPDATLTRAGSCEGCEREGARTETYSVALRDDKGAERTCAFDQQKWASYPDGSKWNGEVRLVGGLDCTSLASP